MIDKWRYTADGAPWYYKLFYMPLMWAGCVFFDTKWKIEKKIKARRDRKLADQAPDAERLRKLAGIIRK